jgi:hypothetical protein
MCAADRLSTAHLHRPVNGISERREMQRFKTWSFFLQNAIKLLVIINLLVNIPTKNKFPFAMEQEAS